MHLCLCVCPFATYFTYFKKVFDKTAFFFGGSLPSDLGREPFEQENFVPGKGRCRVFRISTDKR